MRGYLWQNLREEVWHEFALFGGGLQRESGMVRRAIENDVAYSVWKKLELQRLPSGWRWRVIRAETSRAKREAGLTQIGRPKGSTKKMPAAPTRAQVDYQKRKARGMREKLLDDREGLTHHFTIIAKTPDGNGTYAVDGYIQTGMYLDGGRLGEIFVKVGKLGAIEAMFDQWAIMASLLLQFGAPVEDVFSKFVGSRFEPFGATNNKSIPRCTSVLDYVSRWVLMKYGAES